MSTTTPTVSVPPSATAALIAHARTLLDRIARRLAIPWRLRCTAAGARKIVQSLCDAAGVAMRKAGKALARSLAESPPPSPLGIATPAGITAKLSQWVASCMDILAPHHFAGAWVALRGAGMIPPGAGASAGASATAVPSAAAVAEVNVAVATQRSYLVRFAAAIAGNKVSILSLNRVNKDSMPVGTQSGGVPRVASPGFLARAALYGSAVWGTAERVRRAVARTMYREERRMLGGSVGRTGSAGATHACVDCLAAAAAGWVPCGTLRAIGDSVCTVRCRCTFSFR